MRVKDMADRTLPPKKSRTGFDDEGEPKEQVNGEEREEEEDEEYVNIFQTTVLEGKRRHFVPKGGKETDDWLDEHVEEKEGHRVSGTALYNFYVEMCMTKQINNAMAEYDFVKYVRKKFENGQGIKEGSSLKDKVKVTKKSDKTASSSSTPRVTKDIIQDGFKDLQFPRDGVMFNTLKKQLIPKHPAIRLDLKPNMLLNALNHGVRLGYIELLRGIGKSGKYRWYDEEADKKEEEEEEEMRRKKKAERLAKKEGTDVESKDDKDGEKKEGDDGKKEDGKSEEEGDEKKEGEKSEEGESKKTRGRKRKATPSSKKAKTKKKKKTAKQPKRPFIVHSEPQRIEDTFPLAMTFMAEPKKANFITIEKYIDNNYRVEIKTEKLMKTLDMMEDKGYLEKTHNAGRSSVYQLTLDEFDPTDDDDLIGKIVNAIMASVQPKECSVRSLKTYVTEFYADFKVADKPFLFKHALERAERNNMIRRVTGIGMSGTFQLVDSFVPSPVILAGKDTGSDYEGDDDVSSDEGILSEDVDVDVSMFMDAYQPRPTKRRGKVREVQKSGFNPNQAYIDAQLRQQAARLASRAMYRQHKKKTQKNKLIRTPKKRRYEESSGEEQEDSDDEEEKADSEDDVDSTYGSDGEKYKPRPSSSRGGTPRKATPSKSKSRTPVKKSTTKKASSSKKAASPKRGAAKSLAKKAAKKAESSKNSKSPKKAAPASKKETPKKAAVKRSKRRR